MGSWKKMELIFVDKSESCVYLRLYAHHLSSIIRWCVGEMAPLFLFLRPFPSFPPKFPTFQSCINFPVAIIMIVINLNRKYLTVS